MEELKFYGQFKPPIDELLWEKLFKEKRNGFFIECGAHDGVRLSSCKFFEESMGWRGINIEAIPPLYDQLVENRPDSINIHAALSDHEGTATIITKHENSFAGTLRDVANPEDFKISYEVPCITYAKVLSDHNIEHVDLMVLDVEGVEDIVLADMVTCDPEKLPKVLCVEHSVVRSTELKEFLLPAGYVRSFWQRVNSVYVLNNRDLPCPCGSGRKYKKCCLK